MRKNKQKQTKSIKLNILKAIYIIFINTIIMLSIDEEWNNYISSQHSQFGNNIKKVKKIENDVIIHPPNHIKCPSIITPKILSNEPSNVKEVEIIINTNIDKINCIDDYKTENVVPLCDELYISTKTKVVFLNKALDIHNIFWNIPIIDYWNPMEGVVKKQIKVVSKTIEEYNMYKERLHDIKYYNENIIKQIDNQNARRIKFRDERKITIGLSKKDIMNCRSKIKNAFYNCFAIIIRFKYEELFREIHVKVFNTGKMEIPGILNYELLDIVKDKILSFIQPFDPDTLYFIENSGNDNVLINSNFNCGFYINREKLHSILSKKYGIETSYDPCSYPGVKCKYYFNNDLEYDNDIQNGKIIMDDRSMKMCELTDNKKYTEVSFMIFRTGSCLIVGNCSEKILLFIFNFIKKILYNEFINISVINNDVTIKNKKKKIRKKMIIVSNSYLQSISSTS